MLHTQTVEKGSLALIQKLMTDDTFREFNLVGGTALALRIGHRRSIDIDLFSSSPFTALSLTNYLADKYKAADIRTLSNAVFCFVDDVKIDLIAHQYPLIGDIYQEEGIRMVSLEDIGARKLNAIYNSGQRLKDFVDLYYLLEIMSFDQLFRACYKKYPDLDLQMVKVTAQHFGDIDHDIPIYYIGQGVEWPDVAQRLNEGLRNPSKTFKISEITKRLLEKKPSNKRGRKLYAPEAPH